MIHTSLSRAAHVFAINWSGSDNRRSLLPGRLPIVKRRLLLSVAMVAIAVVAGFAAGRSLPSASVAMPVSAPSGAAANPQLPFPNQTYQFFPLRSCTISRFIQAKRQPAENRQRRDCPEGRNSDLTEGEIKPRKNRKSKCGNPNDYRYDRSQLNSGPESLVSYDRQEPPHEQPAE